MKISVIGTGIYGVALSLDMASNGHDITMWTESEKLAKHFLEKHDLKPITDAFIPDTIKVTSNLKEALENTDFVVFVTAAKYVRETCQNMKKYFNSLTPICIASKGIENDTYSFLSDIIRSELKAKHISVISGPTFAQDLINNEPVGLSVSITSNKALKYTEMAFANERVKLRENRDLYGTQLCGSIKNVIAIAAGILDGLGFSESTRAFLITESTHDIKELLEKMECNPKTIMSFAGIGDLMLTASSPKSRNYRYGKLLGERKDEKEIDDYLKNNTTEGYYTLLSIKGLTKNRKIKMPIINIIYDIAINHKDPDALVDFLMTKA